MRRPPRALLAWSAAALVALGTARVVATDLAALHRRARELDTVAEVVVARDDLQLGTVVHADDLRTVRTAGALVRSSLLDPDDAVGRVVVVPIVAGAPLSTANLAPASRDPTHAVVPRGMRAVHVSADSGLRPAVGAVVDVLVTFDPSIVVAEGGGSPTTTVARAATVLPGPTDGDSVDDLGRAGITLLVTEDEAHRLAFASANGVLTIALAPPEDACCKPSSSASSRD